MTILYEGIVNIKLKYKNNAIKEYCIKNTGTPALFKAIAQCLAGYHADSNMPQYIDIQQDGVSILKDTILLPGTAKSYQQIDSTWATLITQTILLSDFSISPSSLSEDVDFCLLDGNKQKLASVTEDSSVFAGLAANTELIVEWNMFISQPETSEE